VARARAGSAESTLDGALGMISLKLFGGASLERDGAILSGAKIERFDHNDAASLARVLEQLDSRQAKVIVVDGVYSMEGHVADLPRLQTIYRRVAEHLLLD